MKKTLDKILLLYFLLFIIIGTMLFKTEQIISKQKNDLISQQNKLIEVIKEQKILIDSIEEQKKLITATKEQKKTAEIKVQKALVPVIKKESYYVSIINGQITKESLLSICKFIGPKYSILPELLYAMCVKESTRFVNARNGSCKGLMQVNENFHINRMISLKVTDIYDPYGNILLAADFINELNKEKNNIYYTLMRYNMATETANNLFKKGIITNYASSIVNNSKELEQLNRK